MDVILDTNALSALADGDRGLSEALADVQNLCLPVVVLGEYSYGISRSKYQKSYQAWLRKLLKDTTVLPVLDSTAAQYADICQLLRKAGTPIPTNDIWIASLALEHRLPLVTRDQHFSTVNGLTRIDF